MDFSQKQLEILQAIASYHEEGRHSIIPFRGAIWASFSLVEKWLNPKTFKELKKLEQEFKEEELREDEVTYGQICDKAQCTEQQLIETMDLFVQNMGSPSLNALGFENKLRVECAIFELIDNSMCNALDLGGLSIETYQVAATRYGLDLPKGKDLRNSLTKFYSSKTPPLLSEIERKQYFVFNHFSGIRRDDISEYLRLKNSYDLGDESVKTKLEAATDTLFSPIYWGVQDLNDTTLRLENIKSELQYLGKNLHYQEFTDKDIENYMNNEASSTPFVYERMRDLINIVIGNPLSFKELLEDHRIVTTINQLKEQHLNIEDYLKNRPTNSELVDMKPVLRKILKNNLRFHDKIADRIRDLEAQERQIQDEIKTLKDVFKRKKEELRKQMLGEPSETTSVEQQQEDRQNNQTSLQDNMSTVTISRSPQTQQAPNPSQSNDSRTRTVRSLNV